MNDRLKTKSSTGLLNSSQWINQQSFIASKRRKERVLLSFLFIIVLFFPLLVESNTEQQIVIDKTNLNFGAILENGSTTHATAFQEIQITNRGQGEFEWGAVPDQDWLICSPNSGTLNSNQTATINVGVMPCGLDLGKHNATAYIQDKNSPVTPQEVKVSLDCIPPASNLPPFGSFDTPLEGSNVRSSVPVTGWVLDDVSVENVKIYNGSNFVGDAVLVEGARPDVEQAYPDYPLNYKAGWGYMLLTNFLPNGGNGTYNIRVTATDNTGKEFLLGEKTIHVDNANAVKPFGAIDTPSQGGNASGSEFLNWGWALTPQPSVINVDGSTLNVYVDGVKKGHPKYNIYRRDIADFFPGYNNSDGAAGYYTLDAMGIENGVHTIQWTATDDKGNTDGIGSRFFTVNNTDNDYHNASTSSTQKLFSKINSVNDLPLKNCFTVNLKTGLNEDCVYREVLPDNDGIINVKMKEMGRIELELFNRFPVKVSGELIGYLVINGTLCPLPVGSTLDSDSYKFYWMPGLAYVGNYHLVFLHAGPNSETSRLDVIVNITPKFQ